MKVLFCLLFCTNVLLAQTITGVVSEAATDAPLAYANITLLTKNRGATTNENGEFSFEVKTSLADSLLVSYIGYASQTIAVRDAIEKQKAGLKIRLIAQKEEIDAIVLEVKKAKYFTEKKIGVKKEFIRYGTSIPYEYETCTLIKNPEFREGKINSLVFYLKKREDKLYEVLPTFFRVKFYEYDPRYKQPGQLLSYEDIIVKPTNKTQKVTLSLKQYHIKYPRHGVCVGIEAINLGKKRESKIMYLTAPNVRWTYSEEQLTWSSYKGKGWKKNNNKIRYTVFGKVKYRYTNPLVQLNVQFRK